MLLSDDELLGGPADTRVSEADLARLLGVSPRTVRDLPGRGLAVRADGGGYWLQQSVSRYCQHIRDLAKGQSADGTLAAERLRLTREKADSEALKNAKLRGELVAAVDVEREWADVLRTVRAGMLAVPSRVKAKLPALKVEDLEIVKREIHQALTVTGGVSEYKG